MIALKKAKEQGKLEEFIKEHEKDAYGDKDIFDKTLDAINDVISIQKQLPYVKGIIAKDYPQTYAVFDGREFNKEENLINDKIITHVMPIHKPEPPR